MTSAVSHVYAQTLTLMPRGVLAIICNKSLRIYEHGITHSWMFYTSGRGKGPGVVQRARGTRQAIYSINSPEFVPNLCPVQELTDSLGWTGLSRLCRAVETQKELVVEGVSDVGETRSHSDLAGTLTPGVMDPEALTNPCLRVKLWPLKDKRLVNRI